MTNLEKLEADIRGKLPRVEYGAMLNDVLEWLNLINTMGNYGINSNGQMLYWGKSEGQYIISHIEWDLSSVYLKDQSQELIDYLAGLI